MLTFLTWLLFGSVLILALPLQLLGLPGTWLLLAGAALFRWATGPAWLEYHTLIVLLIMAVTGEFLEFFTAIRGARSGPEVRGGVAASIVGALAGGLLGAPVLFGLGAIPGMAVGAWCAVFIVALGGGHDRADAARAALGALTGRLKGTVAKMMVAATMVAVIITSLIM
ncbi:MAG: DUF456 family protein [bacterium]|nr:DUF456 family protein [bacterium]MDT8395031.1 DUF456 family protein [bacterium]